jgi:hypothetical protein
VRRDRLRVALAAGAGLVTVVIWFSALYATSRYITAVLEYQAQDTYYYTSPSLGKAVNTWLYLASVTVILALPSFSLPPLALGARGDRALIIAVLYGLGFCAFAVFWIVSLPNNAITIVLALMALVATPVIGALVAVREEGPITPRLSRAIMIAAAAIYCASLLAYWAVHGEEGWLGSLAPVIVASSSWLVLPAIVVSLRSG